MAPKIHPETGAKKVGNRVTTHLRKFGQWTLMPVVAISGYACLFCGCCVPNPALNMVLYEDDDEERYNDEHAEVLGKWCMRSIGAGILGVLGTVCGVVTVGGCCGSCSPKQMGF